MKKLLFLSISLSLQQILLGQTLINSNILQSTTWSPGESPYLIEAAITVNNNVTLTILPGTVIKIKSFSGSLTGQGDIVAIGTDTQPIIFTSQKDDTAGGDSNNDGSATTPAPEDWRFVAINASGSQFKNCEFRYGGSAPTGGDGAGALRVGVDISIENCIFLKNRKGLVVLNNAKPVLKSCRFQENLRVPFSRMLGADPSFENCEFIGNQYNGVGLEPADFNGYAGSYTLSPPSIIGLNTTTYIIGFFEKIELKPSGSLTILPGVAIKFSNLSQGIIADGTFNAQGTSTKPIIFTSLKDDTAGGDTNNDGTVSVPNSEDWSSVAVGSNNTILTYCEFKYGGSASSGGDGKGGLRVSANATIENCLFFKNRKGLVVLDNGKPTVKNCTFKENLRTPVSRMLGAEPLLEFCTFHNNQYDAFGLEPTDFNGYTGQYEIAPLALSGLNGWAYFIQGFEKIEIKPGAQLRIKPGVVIKTAPFSNGLSVAGTLVAEGTKDNPVVFTSYKDDNWGGDSNKDGASTQPGFDDWPGILLQGTTASNSVLKHCLFRFGGNSSVSGNLSSLKLKDCQPNIKNCSFESNGVGLRTETSGGAVLVDSCVFTGNKIAVKVLTGSITIQGSEFEQNNTFNIENLSPQDLNAPGNWWGVDDYLTLLSDPNANLPLLFDKKDDASKGNILINNPAPPQPGIRLVTPGEVILAQVTAKITVLGYPLENGAVVRLKKTGAPDILPSDTITYINIGSLEFDIDLTNTEPGFYDLVVTNPNGDSLELKSALNVLNETGVPFDEWIPFNVTNGNAFVGKVIVPPVPDLFVLVKKADRTGYASTWRGNVSLSRNTLFLSNTDEYQYVLGGSSSDLNIQSANIKPGFYNFQVKTFNEKGKGFIKFTGSPDTLEMNTWGKGEILRPYGYDWKMLIVPPGIDTLRLQTEGLGLWSTLEVFKDSLKSKQKWFFSNWGAGYEIKGKIPKPTPGRYLIRYKDSAVLQADASGNLFTGLENQRREYLIRADVTGQLPLPVFDLKVINLSRYKVGQGFNTFEINGLGLAQGDSAVLSRASDTLKYVVSVTDIVNNGRNANARFDLSMAEPGEWDFFILNTLGDTAYAPQKVTITNDSVVYIWTRIIARETMRTGRVNTVTVEYGNAGNMDARNTYILLAIPGEIEHSIDLPIVYAEEGDTLAKPGVQFVYIPNMPVGVKNSFDLKVKLPQVGSYEIGAYPVFGSTIDLLTRSGYIYDVFRKQRWLYERNLELFDTISIPQNGEQVYRRFTANKPDEELLWPVHTGLFVQEAGVNYVLDFDTRSGGSANKVPFEIWKQNGYIGHGRAANWTSGIGDTLSQNALAFFNTLQSVTIGQEQRVLNWKNYFPLPTDSTEENCFSYLHLLYNLTGFNPQPLKQGSGSTDDLSRIQTENNIFSQQPASNINGKRSGGLLRTSNNMQQNSKGLADRIACDRAAASNVVGTITETGGNESWGSNIGVHGAKMQVPILANNQCLDDLPKKTITGVGSTTPEDKFGPNGFDLPGTTQANQKNFLRGDGRFSYRIDYWNKEDATAPAAEVFIRDTLDADFDPTTLNFTSFGFLRWDVPLEGGQYFNTVVDLRPDFDLLVNVEGSFDPSTREIYWVHRSLDPLTLELPDDPTAGYLPPIDSTGYNIGWVNFSVKPKPNMPSKTVFTNQARVNFDGVGPWGPAPPYGPYTNVFDFDAPESAVTMLAPQTSTASFEVKWAGDDGDGCGIRSYTIYVSENGGSYHPWLSDTSATNALFKGASGSYYNFYSEATDNLGNKEQEAPHADASTLVVSTYTPTEGGELPILFQNIPNPFSTSTQIPFYLPRSSQVQIEIVDLLGRRLVSVDQAFGPGINTLQLSKEDLLPGTQVLICQLKTGNHILQKKLFVTN